MAFCYQCGEEIEFINNGFSTIPIHPSGSCSGRGGLYGGGHYHSSFRSTNDGEMFEFPFITYPSYVNPNARCPVCDAGVYFYQSPYGGRVFFDELGPPWPKHPCTDNPIMRHHFSSAKNRSHFLVGTVGQAEKGDSQAGERKESTTGETLSAEAGTSCFTPWAQAGWMPFIVTRIIPRSIGIEAEGKLFLSAGSESIAFRIFQVAVDAQFYRIRSLCRFGYSLVQNISPVLSALNESPILIRKDPDLQHVTVSSFILTREGEVEEITLAVSGQAVPTSAEDIRDL